MKNGKNGYKKMVRNLNIQQAKFLRYLCDNHKGLGRTMTISSILQNGEYHTEDIFKILRAWRELRLDKNSTSAFTAIYGKPTKYLKG